MRGQGPKALCDAPKDDSALPMFPGEVGESEDEAIHVDSTDEEFPPLPPPDEAPLQETSYQFFMKCHPPQVVALDPCNHAPQPLVAQVAEHGRKRARPDAPAQISALISSLAAVEPSDHRGHLRAVSKRLASMKRPAAAPVAEAPAPAAEASAPVAEAPAPAAAAGAVSVLKRPAAAAEAPAPAAAAGAVSVLKRPASKLPKLSVEAPAAEAPAEVPSVEAPVAEAPVVLLSDSESDSKDEMQTRKALLQRCLSACEDEACAGNACRVVASFQRGCHLFQIQDLGSRKTVCQTSDRSFGSVDLARRAADILAELYTLGCTAADLQRCKLKGSLFGIKCGRKVVSK